MRDSGWREGFLFLLLLVLSTFPFSREGACSEIPVIQENPGILNFGVVTEGKIYRSGRLEPDGIELMLQAGIRTVFDLRKEKSDNEIFPMEEFHTYFHLGIEDHQAPSERQAKALLEIVRRAKYWPVLIHCHGGRGRTGVIVALIRYAIEGWSLKEALEEAKLYRNGVPLNVNDWNFLHIWASKHPPGDTPYIE